MKLSEKIKQILHQNELPFIVLALAHTYLFYEQSIGINYLIFSLMITFYFILRDIELIKKPSFIILSLGTIISGVCCYYYGHDYFKFENIISCFLLASVTYSVSTTLHILVIQSLYSTITSPLYFIHHLVQPCESPTQYSKGLRYILLSIIPILVAIIFGAIYAYSNPILNEFLLQFDLEFVTISLVIYAAFSFGIIYVLINQNHIKWLESKDLNHSDELNSSFENLYTSKLNFLTIKSEVFISIFIFVLLNIILAINNGLDIYYIFFKKIMPHGMSFSEYIHQGVNTLILSIAMAILLIMYVFNSRLNFVESTMKIKAFAYLWIIQNLVLIYICIFKNQQYIMHFDYTYKRLGVYFFLLLSAIGLVLTAYKLVKNKSNHFLLRRQSWAIYTLVIFFFVMIGMHISRFRILRTILTTMLTKDTF